MQVFVSFDVAVEIYLYKMVNCLKVSNVGNGKMPRILVSSQLNKKIPSVSKSTKNIGFIRFTKSKNRAAQRCYSLKARVSVLDCNLNLTYLTWILSSNDRKFRTFENMISKILQTITKKLNFLSKISRQFFNFIVQKKMCNSIDTMVKTQVVSSKVNTLFEVFQFQHRTNIFRKKSRTRCFKNTL